MRYLTRVVPFAALSLLAVGCSRPSADPETQVLAAPQPQAPVPAAPIEVNSFYDDLAPYGDWVEMPDYGWSFAPRVDDDWRPYTRGQWEYTDDGWYWDSDEDFGWATYHYGRWVDDPRYGWIWVPGEEWAPAWVSWRQGNGYTGWAPLPPRARWNSRAGLAIGGLELDAYIGARDYNFVEDRNFVDRGVYQRIQPSSVNVTIINRTSNVTNYTTVNNRVYNRGVAIGDVERSVGRKVTQLRTVDRDRHDGRGGERAGQVAVFRPQVRITNDRKPSRGSSLVKGEALPPAVAERAQRRGGNPGTERDAHVTARDAAQQPRNDSKPGARPSGVQTPPPVPQQPVPNRDQPSRDAEAQRARAQEQQRVDAERRQNEQHQREQQAEAARQKRNPQPAQPVDAGQANGGRERTPRPAPTRQPVVPRTEPREQDQAAQRQHDQAAQEAARQQQQAQAQQQQQQRTEREKAAADQQQRGKQQHDRQSQAEADRGKRQENPPPQPKPKEQPGQDKKGPPPGHGNEHGKNEPKPTPSPGA